MENPNSNVHRYIMTIFAVLFLVVGVPALVVGYYDVMNRPLFLVTVVLVGPMIIGQWWTTVVLWARTDTGSQREEDSAG